MCIELRFTMVTALFCRELRKFPITCVELRFTIITALFCK